jgi:hypothetical protein
MRISAHGHGQDQQPGAEQRETALPVGLVSARRTFLLSSAVMGAGVGTLTLYPQVSRLCIRLSTRFPVARAPRLSATPLSGLSA